MRQGQMISSRKGLTMRRLGFAAALTMVLVMAGLVHAGDLSKFKRRLGRELASQDYTAAAATIRELGEEDSLEAVKLIVKLALDERIESHEIFKAAKEALSSITDEKAIKFLCEKARKRTRDWRLKAFFAEILGNLRGEGIVDALISLLKDRKQEVVREAITALAKQRDIKAVETLIETLARLETEKGEVWIEARKALTSLTGADHTTAQKWREYWRVRKDELKAHADSPETSKPSMTGEPRTSLDEEIKKAPKFFGKEIMSRRIVFVIDVSGSMIMKDRPVSGGEAGKGPKGASEYSRMPTDRMRINRAKAELKKAVAGLPPSAKFNIIAFAMGVSPWQKKRLVLANSRNKRAAFVFVDKFIANGGTFTDDALKEAFANEEADTIFFLSDGAPERYASVRGQENPQNTELIGKCLDYVRQANKFRKVKIYAFGFDGEGVWDPNRGTKPAYHKNAGRFINFMRSLAEENGGEYKSVK